jgi:hypothetical protein
MGKTAIAHTIALLQLAEGWEALDCRIPEDFFRSYDRDRNQVFVADDAFGRTEFDPTLARAWERDLPKLLARVDSRHWLLWTTRRHILVRALREIDLEGGARRFPEPGEIIVQTQDLSIGEKARMLYRHAKAGELRTDFRLAIRKQAREIVKSPHFTPERIRRLIQERLPEIS